MSGRDPSQERLNELFVYKDGILFNRINRGPRSRKGQRVGTKNVHGYLQTSIDYKQCLVHRLIYIMHRGDILEKRVIDHENGIKDDNRIENLRVATIQENAFNTKSKGYYWNKERQKYTAQICVDYMKKHLGNFDKEEDAIKARADAKEKYHIIEKR